MISLQWFYVLFSLSTLLMFLTHKVAKSATNRWEQNGHNVCKSINRNNISLPTLLVSYRSLHLIRWPLVWFSPVSFCLQGYLLFSLAISLTILASAEAQDYDYLEDLDDLITAESQSQSRNARFLKMPSLFKRKIRIKKRIGPLDPRPPFNPAGPRQRLHMKRPQQPLVKRPQPPPSVAKYPKVGKMGRLGPVPPPQPSPARPNGLRPKKQPRPAAPRPVKKLPSRHLNKKQLHSVEKPIYNEIRPQGPQRILKKPMADERFFFGNRGRRRPRPQYKKKKPKRRPHKRPAKRPVAHKPKAPKKTTTYKTTTKAPAYKPTEPSYEVEVTSYKPSEAVYEPTHDVDEFPAFPNPDFPDFMASFMPDFNFDINKINCKFLHFSCK